MIRREDLLNSVRVEKPCHADWCQMTGDARRKFCSECGLHVNNLSEMSRKEAGELLGKASGRLCVRYQRGRSGKPIYKSKIRRLRAGLAAVALILVGCGSDSATSGWASPHPMSRLLKPTRDWLESLRETREVVGEVPAMGLLVEPSPGVVDESR